VIDDTDNFTHTFTAGGTFTVRLILEQDVGGVPCTADESIVITVNDLGLNISEDSDVCAGSPVTVEVTPENPGNTIIWTNELGNILGNDFTITQFPTSNDTYTATVTGGGCTISLSTNITFIDSLNLMPNTLTRVIGESGRNNSVVLESLGDGLDSLNVVWNSGDLDVTDPINAVLTNGIGEDDIRTFIATVGNGCFSEQFVRIVTVLSLPNIFSPNDDSRNENFNILGDFDPNIVANFRIFNRWGQVIYNNENPLTGWDGTFRGEDQPVGVYVYIVELTSGDTVSGDVTLLR